MFADINLVDDTRTLPRPALRARVPGRRRQRAAPVDAQAHRAGPPARTTRLRSRIALVAVALVIPALLTLQDRSATPADRVVLFLLMLAMTAAAVLRIVQALHAAERPRRASSTRPPTTASPACPTAA